jgi:ABC-type antimicrobial peptide transport system permease subunit
MTNQKMTIATQTTEDGNLHTLIAKKRTSPSTNATPRTRKTLAIVCGIEQVAGIQTSVSGTSVAVAFFVSCTVGLIFGIVPAWRAAQQDVVTCLRYE